MDYSFGIDIGGTNTDIGLVDCKGNIVIKRRLSTASYTDSKVYISDLANTVISFFSQLTPKDMLLGVGIGAPNGNYYRGTIEYAPNLPFKGIVYLKNDLELLFTQVSPPCKLREQKLKVVVTNDANAAAVGEMVYGKAKNVKDFMMITLGTGLGSGIVVDGKLVYGHTGFAGEIGHTIIESNGRLCNCGRRGCLERYCSATGIVLTAKEKLHSSTKQSLLSKLDEQDITSHTIYQAALQKDSLALECFDFTAKKLALALANAAQITSPSKIYLFGGLAQSGDLLLKPLREYFQQDLFNIFQSTIDIEISALEQDNAAVLGAAALCY